MSEGYKPLTPSFRAEIDKGFDDMISELKTCKPNALIIAQINALNTYKKTDSRTSRWLSSAY